MSFIVSEIDSLHRKRLKVNFETDEAQQEFEIESKTREITEIFHHAETLLKRFGKQSEDPSLTSAERTVRKNMQMAMAKKLQSLSLGFRSQQKVWFLPSSHITTSQKSQRNIWKLSMRKKWGQAHKRLTS
jgi:hypothetical protein